MHFSAAAPRPLLRKLARLPPLPPPPPPPPPPSPTPPPPPQQRARESHRFRSRSPCHVRQRWGHDGPTVAGRHGSRRAPSAATAAAAAATSVATACQLSYCYRRSCHQVSALAAVAGAACRCLYPLQRTLGPGGVGVLAAPTRSRWQCQRRRGGDER